MKYSHTQLIRVTEEDREAIAEMAERLGLSQSEVARRSLRIALPILRTVNLPGSPMPVTARSYKLPE